MTETIGQLTAPNLRVEAANGVRYVYRRFGNAETSALPLLMLVHYRANLDNWDPALVDALAQAREVVLIDNIGVAGSSGMTPSTVGEMALGVIAFTDALDLYSYDLLGFSLGGFVAQEVAMRRLYAVRRLVLAGTGPEGGRDMHVYSGRIRAIAVSDEPAIEDLLTLFFEDTATSQARGQEFLRRIQTRRTDRDEFALACDLRYASRDRAVFQQPEVGVGILPGGGASERLPRLVGRDRALEVILTSDDYDADTAERYGWVTRTLPDDELDQFVDSLAQRLARFDRQALGAAKAQIGLNTLPDDHELYAAYDAYFASLGWPGYRDRGPRLVAQAASHGADVELRLGHYLGRL
jgi:pimeloyl-ACP methyl ester carboxylesterase